MRGPKHSAGWLLYFFYTGSSCLTPFPSDYDFAMLNTIINSSIFLISIPTLLGANSNITTILIQHATCTHMSHALAFRHVSIGRVRNPFALLA